MTKYAINNDMGGTKQNVTTTYKTQLILSAQTTGLTRGRIFHMLLGVPGTPANNAMEYSVQKSTSVGTGTTVTPSLLDPYSSASGTVGTANLTAEPSGVSVATSLFYLPLNQQASFQWIAKDGCELIWPATNLNGLAILARSPVYTSTVGVTAYHEE